MTIHFQILNKIHCQYIGMVRQLALIAAIGLIGYIIYGEFKERK